MDKQVPPPVTITGGPGWVVDTSGASGDLAAGGAGRDVSGQEAAPSRPRARQALALGAAFLVGFATSQVLSDERRSALGRSPESQLSLALGGAVGPDYVTDAGGRLAVALSLVVRNDGPVDVVLESATVGGLSDADVEGRTILADGLTRISLTRAVDCAELPPTAVQFGPLVVRARTPAGSREARLPLDEDPGDRFARRLRAACGQVPPEAALDLGVAVLQFEERAARLPLVLGNTSARDVVVTAVRPPEGLQLELLDADGAPAVFPLRLPAADFSVPRPPEDAGRARTRLTAVLSLGDCQALPSDLADAERPLLELTVATDAGGPATTFGYGDGERLLRRLAEAGCPPAAAAPG